jgi:hypothetical protein
MSEPDNPDTESDLPIDTRVSFSKTGGKIQITGTINSGKAYVVRADNDGSLRVILRKDLTVRT